MIRDLAMCFCSGVLGYLLATAEASEAHQHLRNAHCELEAAP